VLPGLTASLLRGRTKALPADDEFAALKEALGLKASGPGMLARVKQLAEGMGGRVWVGSEVGGGSTVTVLIPARSE
jgi:signal transduction histidine kinase